MADISNNIKALRAERGMSQAQLAEKLSVARQTVSSWERGASFPDIPMLEKLSAVFEISADELLFPRRRTRRRRTGDSPLSLSFVLLSVLVYALLLIWGGALVAVPLLRKLLGGGMGAEATWYLVWGMILLVGYIALCAALLSEYMTGAPSGEQRDEP